MALHLLRSFVPVVNQEEGKAALARILTHRGCHIERVVSHTAGDLLDLQATLSSGMRLYTQFESVKPGGPATWILDERIAGMESWDPLLSRELSVALGGFAVSVEASRTLSRHGYAVFFAGRTIEFTSDDPIGGRFDLGELPSDESTATRIEHVYPAFMDLYTHLTGYPASDLIGEPDTRLSSFLTKGSPCEVAWRPRAEDEPSLALAVFALAEEQEFTLAWEELGAVRPQGWHRRGAATTSSQIPYVLLTRDGELDMDLCEAIARRLEVPAAAVAVQAPGARFDWWDMQPGELPRHGQGRGAVEFVRRLMPATVALGERPGVLRLRHSS